MFMHQIYKKLPSISHSESVFNTIMIFPLINTTIDLINNNGDHNHKNTNIYFVPGEEHLHSMTTQLNKIGERLDDRFRYKGDGIIRVLNLDDTEK
ncbi:unnamed protein product [Cunninghamella blakesleeana]